MKLSGARSPYFNLGVVKAGEPGHYKYMSTRNNNFSNRGQKGEITIVSGPLSAGSIAGIVVGSAVGVAALAALSVFTYRKMSSSSSGTSRSYLPQTSKTGSG